MDEGMTNQLHKKLAKIEEQMREKEKAYVEL